MSCPAYGVLRVELRLAHDGVAEVVVETAVKFGRAALELVIFNSQRYRSGIRAAYVLHTGARIGACLREASCSKNFHLAEPFGGCTATWRDASRLGRDCVFHPTRIVAAGRNHGPSLRESGPRIIMDCGSDVHHQTLEVSEIVDAQERGPEHLVGHE